VKDIGAAPADARIARLSAIARFMIILVERCGPSLPWPARQTQLSVGAVRADAFTWCPSGS
jgi:hypothetical protein